MDDRQALRNKQALDSGSFPPWLIKDSSNSSLNNHELLNAPHATHAEGQQPANVDPNFEPVLQVRFF